MNAVTRLLASMGRSAWALVVAFIFASASAVILLDSGDSGEQGCESFTGDVSETPCFSATLQNGNLVTLAWRTDNPTGVVYIYDDRPPAYSDPGFQRARCPEHPLGACTIEIPLSEGGYYQWTLAVGEIGDQFHVRASIDLPPPPAPRLLEGGGFVDLLRPSDQAFSWQAEERDDGLAAWVEIREPGLGAWLRKRFPRSGPEARHTEPASRFQTVGEVVYLLRDCHLPAGSDTALCSPTVSAGYYAGYDSFKGVRNRHLAADEPLQLEFTERSGDMRLLSVRSRDPEVGLMFTEPQASGELIDSGTLKPGRYDIALDSCIYPDGPCSNRKVAAQAPTGGVFWQKAPGYYPEGGTLGTVYPLDGSPPVPVRSTRAGTIEFAQPGPLHMTESWASLAFETSGSGDLLHLFVGAPVDWETGRSYLEDFYPGTAGAARGSGQPLDILFDGHGGIWMLNEFANGVEYLSPDGTAYTLGFPLARHRNAGDPPTYRITQPFNVAWSEKVTRRSTISPLAERVMLFEGKLWFTQGGALKSPADDTLPNASRIISFDPLAKDQRGTAYDDRFCVYNMPIAAGDPGNQQVVGIAGAGNRIWVAETRGLTDSESASYLSSFIPAPELCHNLLDFDDPQALQDQPMRYCRDQLTPEQDACVERVALPAAERPIKIAHLQADPDRRTLWFTDASGQFLGSYDLLGEQGFKLRQLQDTHFREPDTVGDLGGYLWDLEVTHDAVYAAEYATRHIVRFDKKSQRFDEIAIPYKGKRVRLHSIALDEMRQRLWFTLANECSAPRSNSHSTIGYLDLDSWEYSLEQPSRRRVRGVVYAGLESIPSCEMHPGKHQSFRGIAVEAGTGRIALATMLRGQFTLLEPLPGFWP